MAKLAAPSGFRDFLPDEHRKRQELIGRIRASYESFGFEGMDTPAMENLQVFLGKGGGENEKLMFRVLKRGAELERAVAVGPWRARHKKTVGSCDATMQLAQGRTIDT